MKNVIVFFFGNQISKDGSSFEKRAIFDLLFEIVLVTRETSCKNGASALYLTHIHSRILLTVLTFCKKALPILYSSENTNLIRYGFASLWYES